MDNKPVGHNHTQVERFKGVWKKRVVCGYDAQSGNPGSRHIQDEYQWMVLYVKSREGLEPDEWWQGDLRAVMAEYI